MRVDIKAELWEKLLPPKILQPFQRRITEGSASVADLPIQLISHLPLQNAAIEREVIFRLFSPPPLQNLDPETQAHIDAGDWLHIAAYLIKLPNSRVANISCRISKDHLLIFGVDVNESYRGRGIMKLLMAHVMAIAARLRLAVKLTDESRSYPSFLDDEKRDSQNLETVRKIQDLIVKFNIEFRNPYDTLGFLPLGGWERTANVSKVDLKPMFKSFLRRNSFATVSSEENPENKLGRSRAYSF